MEDIIELKFCRPDVEEAVLGSLLIDPRCAGLVFGQARREQFTDDELRALFDAARRLWNDRRPIDPLTVLENAGFSVDRLGERVAKIMRETPTAANVEEYVRLLGEYARLRQLRAAAYDLRSSPTLELAETAFEKLGKTLTRRGYVESVAWVDCVSEYIDRMRDGKPPEYLTWSLREIDERLHVEAGDFVILGAEPSAGKTALSLQFAYAQASAGIPVGFFSLETPRTRLVDRLMAETQVAGIELLRSRLHKLGPRDYERAGAAGMRADHIPLKIVRNAWTIDDIRGETILSGYKVIYIDYLQLIRMPGASRHETVTNVSIELHRLASELGVTVVALSQVTNAEKGKARKAATKNDLRESDQLLQDAEIIMMLNVSGPNTRILSVEKNKDEGISVFDLEFDAKHMSFGYLPPPKKRDRPSPDNVKLEELDDDEGGPLPF